MATLSTETTQRQPRSGAKYPPEDRQVIDPFKQEYQAQTSKAGRLQMLKNDILPALFNHWASKGKLPKDIEESKSWSKVTYGSARSLTGLLMFGRT